jgi:uncharacterized protein (TIGR00255 family)
VIHSMTGFGRASLPVDACAFQVEVRSVNHRYLDVRVRLPRLLAGLEAEVRGRVQRRFGRGKLEVAVLSPEGASPARLEIDLEAAREYARAAQRLRETDGLEGGLDVASVLGLPGVARFVEPEFGEEELGRALAAALDSALDSVEAMRAAEGAALERDLRARIGRVGELVGALEERGGAVQEAVRGRLAKRTEQLARETGLYDEARLHQEVAIAAERMDVTEELVRLRSHLEQFHGIIDSGGPGTPVGRRLDFLLQELGREANTIGAKAADASIAHTVVELKAELERLREQVQNVE